MNIAVRARSYLELCRISNLPSVWSNVLCAVVLTTGRFSWQSFLLPALSMSCFYLGGMCLNDICDAAHDTRHRPDRPIPSERVSLAEALTVTGALFLTGFLPLLQAGNIEALCAAAALVGFIAWYDLDHKENPYSVILMASCRLLLFVTTSLAVSGAVSPKAVFAGLIHFAYIVLLSLVARYENESRTPFTLPVIPLMLSGIAVLDGLILAAAIAPWWMAVGAGAAVMTFQGQRLVRGD